jgi:hypothetical protein
MDDEKNEILNAIQNGFFNEGIYRVPAEVAEVSEEVMIPVIDLKEKAYPAAEVVSVAEVSENKPPLIQKSPEPEIIAEPIILPEFFGGNRKGVAILVNYNNERWIYFKDKIILEKILGSVKLNFDDVALINTHYFKPESIDYLSDKYKITKIIGFGINDPFLKGLKREEPEKTATAAVFLMNSDLNEIAMNVDKKRILWNNLKLMFNIV